MELQGGNAGDTVVAAAQRIGEEVAARWADEVDGAARFPVETVAEMRRAGLLGALVPPAWGGPGVSLAAMSWAVAAISSHCASSGLVLAMHQIQIACLVRHGTPAALDQLLPRVVDGSLLLANANSEVGLGGERRSSICALEAVEGGFHLEKDAATVSYGEYADGIFATARRDPESPPHEQVMAVCLPPSLHLEATGDWDTLGLRGTCSRPGHISADIPAELVLANYADVFVRTSLPVSAVLLSSVWLGIAEAAGRQAHATVRAQGRAGRRPDAQPSPAPPGAMRLAELGVFLHQLRAVIAAGAASYEQHKDTSEVETLRFSSQMDNLKLSSSTLVLEVAQRAMAICGLSGYRNNSKTSMARIMRDAAAAPLMVNNDRVLQAMVQTLLVRKEL
jgi:acyl-CoA dehydrogenase